MRAGRLRHKITVEQFTSGIDSLGDETEAWATYVVRRAEVKPLSGKERFDAAQEQTEISHKITLRADSATKLITAAMRINYGGRLFDIDSPPIDINERGRRLELMCVERSTDVTNV